MIPANKKTYLPNEESNNTEAKSQGMNNKLEYGNAEQHRKNIEILEPYTFDEKEKAFRSVSIIKTKYQIKRPRNRESFIFIPNSFS